MSNSQCQQQQQQQRIFGIFGTRLAFTLLLLLYIAK
jgi:hypothetical protein